MAVIKYIGKYVDAEDALNYIDYQKIKDACNKIKEGCEYLKTSSNKVLSAEEYLTDNDLLYAGLTFDEKVESLAHEYKNTADYLKSFAEMVEEALEVAFNKKQVELNDIARIKDNEQINEMEKQNNLQQTEIANQEETLIQEAIQNNEQEEIVSFEITNQDKILEQIGSMQREEISEEY